MKERRKFERFTLPLPVRLETITLNNNKTLDLETRDISASGTFIDTLTSFPKGTGFIMDFTIPSDNIKEFKYVKVLRGLTGTMVRSTSKGMAIQFDRECYIMSLSGS
jgi:hypothetical protein